MPPSELSSRLANFQSAVLLLHYKGCDGPAEGEAVATRFARVSYGETHRDVHYYTKRPYKSEQFKVMLRTSTDEGNRNLILKLERLKS
jgi:hypothetical protein